MKSIGLLECHRVRPATGVSALPAFALALLPKCPVCLGVYFGFFAILGISIRVVSWSLVIVLGALGVLVLKSIFSSGRRLGRMTPFFLGSAGLLALLATRIVALPPSVAWTGLSSFCLACVLAGMSPKQTEIQS